VAKSERQAGIARVVLLPAVGRLSELDYLVPPALWREALLGCRVLVPLGRRTVPGLICELPGASDHADLKPIVAVLDENPVLDRSLLELVRWMADYYLSPLAEVVRTALPGSLRLVAEKRVRLLNSPPQSARIREGERAVLALLEGGPQPQSALAAAVADRPGLARCLAGMRRRGWIEVSETLHERDPTRHLRFYHAVGDREAQVLAKRPAMRELHRYLEEHPLRRATLPELAASFKNAPAKIRFLRNAGLVRVTRQEVYRSVSPAPVRDRTVTPTEEQREVLAAVGSAEGFSPFLLCGVTGSGKTEVYLRVIADVLGRERSALVLVPEISLTHQLLDRFRARFGERVAVLHSGLGVGERWDEWRRIARGEATIVVGARSAVFAPLVRLGLVVVDEEHDPSYKQEDGVRHHARDVAVVRARLAACPVVLGSATPSMESFHNATTGRYRLLELRSRVESRPLPEVEIVDLRTTRAHGKPARAGSLMISPALIAALRANLAVGGQSLVFLNRRGFAGVVQCCACGTAITCPNCCVALTYHRSWRALRCHHCDHTVRPPSQCPTCRESALTMWGAGTEQVESTVRELLPGARVARMDRDTMARKGAQRALLTAWETGRLDVLIGTQMITKGHDVAGVTLVAVLLADLSLAFPDFRAAERTFQLLTQVAGRAGRGDRAGRVIVQTLQPEHFSLRCMAAHDFAAFAAAEIDDRRELGYPPFSRLVLARAEGEQLSAVQRLSRSFANHVRAAGGKRIVVLGPAPAPIERLRGRYRWQVLCRSFSGSLLRRCVAVARDHLRAPAGDARVRLIIDVDPQGMG
jgi:primosomal protein N' (replication factor Y)